MPTLQETIIAAIKNNPKPHFAVIDFDNTCIANDVGEVMLAYLCRNQLLKDKTLLGESNNNEYHKNVFLRYHKLLAEEKIQEAYMFCTQVLSGFTPSEVTALARTVINAEGENIRTEDLFGISITRGIHPKNQVKDLLNFLETNNIDIWIVSASSQLLVETAMKQFGIQGKAIGVKNKMKGGVLTAGLEKPVPIVEGKIECIRAFIDPIHRPILAAGDSAHDLPMLEYADVKAVVDRQNEFSSTAHSRGWFII